MATQQESSVEAKYIYGVYINIDGVSREAVAEMLVPPAEKKAEVAVSHHGVVKEFTFDDFFERLGFYD